MIVIGYFCHALHANNLNMPADTFLKRRFRDEDIHIKVCLLCNFSSYYVTRTKNTSVVEKSSGLAAKYL